MTVADFIAKWDGHELKERSASQEHFIDLCRLVGHPTPAELDPSGSRFTFERGAAKATGGEGWADVWKKDFFGWEYKGPGRDLGAAYRQLLLYFGALENPPLLVTSDTDRIVVHTHFAGTPTKTYELTLRGLADPEQFAVLRALFHDPSSLRPETTVEAITEEVAEQITEIAQALRGRGISARRVARFLDRLVFCLFAEDVGLLPNRLFTKVIENTAPHPDQFKAVVGGLFAAMASGGHFGSERIAHFNGDLFEDAEVLDLTSAELRVLLTVSAMDWSSIDASIFGTLFERALDPDKRSQLGAHYTSRSDIEALVEPVVMQPLRVEWSAVRAEATGILEAGVLTPRRKDKVSVLLRGFLNRLHEVTVLDPACGSGNFLFVTLQKLKDLEKEVIVFAASTIGGLFPAVDPRQLYGIELNQYAHELAQMTVWIGYLQWVKKNGFGDPDEPILQRMTTFQCKDAILDLRDEGALEPEWPSTEFIVGNPPFLGGKKLRESLGDEYVHALFAIWGDRVPSESDYCCYWFEKARHQIATGRCRRAGLLATQGIRAGANRAVLERINDTGGMFFAISSREWFLDGANVHVAMVGFDGGQETVRYLDGERVDTINADLTTTTDLTKAKRLRGARGKSFMADTKGGAFDVPLELVREWLQLPNPHGRPNSDVLRPWTNGLDVTRRPREEWIIDFPADITRADASRYEAPFAHLEIHVKPQREIHRNEGLADEFWQHERPRPEMRDALSALPRYIATAAVAKHRLFVWMREPSLPDHALIVFAFSDDASFGVLHSRVHQLWALRKGSKLETRPRYTPTTCFETFVFPRMSPEQEHAIAGVASELDRLRRQWLNPEQWIQQEELVFPATEQGPWRGFVTDIDNDGIGTARYTIQRPRDQEAEESLAKRTLTALYNSYPSWLRDLHAQLDDAVLGAYGLRSDADDALILQHLLALNLEESGRDEGG